MIESEFRLFHRYGVAIGICLLLLVGCSDEEVRPFDPAIGIVSRDHQLDAEVLAPIEVRVDGDYENFYVLDHLMFISASGEPDRAVAVHLGKGLRDNKYNPAERDFFGFFYDGKGLHGLAYTKMKHDSTHLEVSYPFFSFGGLTWEVPYRSGVFAYERRGLKFEVRFNGLKPVQYFANRDWRLRVNAFGDATLAVEGDTISGKIYYELIQLEGYNPIDEVHSGVDYINYDWMALCTESGQQLLVSTDSSTSNDLLMRNFVSLEVGDKLWYADGSENVDMISEEVLRDRKIYDWIANKKRVEVPGLDMTVELAHTDTRVFYTNGYAIAVVEGSITIADSTQGVWGIVEHRQQPKTNSEALR